MKYYVLLLAACFAMMVTVAAVSPAAALTAYVVDSNGTVVGQEFPGDLVLLQIDGIWFYLPVDSGGFQRFGGALYYATSDCTGTRYMQAAVSGPRHSLSKVIGGLNAVFIRGTTLYYPGQSVLTVAISSVEYDSGLCQSGSYSPMVSVAHKFDLSSLGLVPPFSIEAK